jgi:hypothetical protein
LVELEQFERDLFKDKTTMKYVLSLPVAYLRSGPSMEGGQVTTYEVRGWPPSEGEVWIDSTSLKDDNWQIRRVLNGEWSEQKGYKTAEEALAALQHECVI